MEKIDTHFWHNKASILTFFCDELQDRHDLNRAIDMTHFYFGWPNNCHHDIWFRRIWMSIDVQ